MRATRGRSESTPRVAFEHAGEVVPSQANPSQEIDLEIVQPILVVDIREILGFIDTEVVHEDVGLGNLCDELLGSFCRPRSSGS
jgi:hypothetical protein